MSLHIVSTPIGNLKDITSHACELLSQCDLVIGEEKAEAEKLLKRLKLPPKPMEFLNEHTKPEEIADLAKLCVDKKVVLISDCGTPVFCDPGSQLIALCRNQNISVTAAPGASSLMTLLSLSSQKIEDFYFAGFLPAHAETRDLKLNSLKNWPGTLVLMDTPYRLSRTIADLAFTWPERKALLGLNLTMPEEEVFEDTLFNLSKKVADKKAEFILLIYGGSHAVPTKDVATRFRRTRKRIDHRSTKTRSHNHRR